MESVEHLAGAVARQWLGVVIYPQEPKDAWVVDGLAIHLREGFIRYSMGRNEAAFRCLSDRRMWGWTLLCLARAHTYANSMDM